ncbi:hypothetical protein ABK040_005041 [Willaertia magna]
MDKKKIIEIVAFLANVVIFQLAVISFIIFCVEGNSTTYNEKIVLPYEMYLITVFLILSLLVTLVMSGFIYLVRHYKARNQENWITRNETVIALIYLMCTGASFMAGIMHSIYFSVYVRALVNFPSDNLLVSAFRLYFSVGIIMSVFSVFNVVNGFMTVLSNSNYEHIN